MAKYSCSKFFLTTFPRKTGINLEWPKMGTPNLFKPFWPVQLIPDFLGRVVSKKLEWPLLAIRNLYLSFWVKLLEKIRNGHFWPF